MDNLLCCKWNDFFLKAFAFIELDGTYSVGFYIIIYNCYFVMVDGIVLGLEIVG